MPSSVPPTEPLRVAPPPGSPLVTHVSHAAMATNFVVLLPENQSHQVETAVQALESLDDIEAKLTVYRPSSEVSRINQGGQQWTKVSAETFSIIEKAILWSTQTNGAFDISAGPLIEAWGFTQRSGRKPNQAQIETALQQVGYQFIELDVDTRRVRFAKPGMSINLGAIGKGEALDCVKRYLMHAGVDDFLIHGGSSSVVARGDQFPGSELGWAVGIAHPTKPKHRLAGVWLKNASVATSGSGKQFFHHKGKRFGHVIDPRTGYPAGDLLSLTVLTNSAADADAMATGLFVAGTPSFESMRTAPWWPTLISVAAATRQDEVQVTSQGEIVWVDE
ncbi:FAD:protein FMN transferase [Rubripirellula amarantea]|nr:FAD:protein FMN transferase [Rubripirellula amarantea]